MKNKIAIIAAVIAAMALPAACVHQGGDHAAVAAARNVIERMAGRRADEIAIRTIPLDKGFETVKIEASGGRLTIEGSSPSAICYGFTTYLREACGSMKTWSGEHLDIPDVWPDFAAKQITTPYRYRYFLNVVTYGYTTPYWDWERWEQEIDWMALHGVNMPLATVASEAIAERVWLQMGLSKEEIRAFFTAPAHLPWHRMGNLNKWDGPLSDAWQAGQLELQHKILDRMKELGMEPIVPAFAGFVPEAFARQHPEIELKHLRWGGFNPDENAYVLPPDSPYFKEIGKRFVQEWEKEFGKFTYYQSDSFNEMELPVAEGDTQGKHKLLAQYGESIYKSIIAGNPDAVWVTQGWTFGYQHKFWDKESLRALLSRVPDNRMVIIDLGNDYPKWVWHTEQTWKTHEGFYGKKWIFSYVPNFGGKTPMTGELEMYATASTEALHSPYGKTLIGFGSAPEGLENNEVVYELLADMGWRTDNIDLDKWLEVYCNARYGGYPEAMRRAWSLLRQSAYGSLYSYPRFTWQTVVPDQRRQSLIDKSSDFMEAVRLFLSCSDELGCSQLYVNDAIELSSLYLAVIADDYYEKALEVDASGENVQATTLLARTTALLQNIDRLLASHPRYRLEEWVGYARGQGTTPAEKDAYEANAKRLITTWGGYQDDYAARFWSGLVSDYYIPRIEMYFSKERSALREWEEQWINRPWISTTQPFATPLTAAKELVATNPQIN
jgi:alpha-N-acetylglucosaminidase